MQEQNFEKQVREKMEELSFAPSEPVWQKVEEQIRKRKDRRRVLFWLLPLLVATGGVVTWLNKESFVSDRQTAISTTSIEQKTTTPVENKTTINSENKNNRTDNTKNTQTNKVDNPHIVQSENEPLLSTSQTVTAKKRTTIHEESKISSRKSIALRTSFKKNNNNQKEKEHSATDEQITGKIASVPSENSKQGSNKTTGATDETTDIASEPVEKQNEHSADSSLVEKEPAKDSAASKTDTTQVFKIAASRKKTKLQWSVRAAGGVSGLASSAFKFLPVASSGVNSNAERLFDQSFSANITNGPSNAIAFQHTPEVYSGSSFSAGADVKKSVSERLNLVAGLGYSYYSTRVYIGSKISNATTLNRVDEQVKVNDYFLATGINKEAYTNQYHFVDLPIGVEWKVFKKLPLQLHSGFTISRLVSTNALYYSNLQNIYYEDEKVFRKTQFSLFTDLSYRLLKFKKGSLHAGPQVQLGLSNLMKKEAYGEQHLFFAGLNAHFDF